MEIWTKQEFKRESNAGLLARRSNPDIRTIDRSLELYHQLDPLEFEARIAVLVTIVGACLGYLEATASRPSRRRPAVQQLLAQAGERTEALARAQRRRARGNWKRAVKATKPLHAPPGSKALVEEHWLELKAPHFAAHEIKSVFDEWKRSSTRKNFADWAESEYLPRAKSSQDYAAAVNAMKLESHRVDYLDAGRRRDYEVTVRGGLVYDASGDLFHTGDLQTAFSGKGWAIFVMSPTNRIYTGSHSTGHFHHSSFLSGCPTKSAGEWAVDSGRVVAVTAKSGHYKPGPEQFKAFLQVLRDGGVNLDRVAAKPDPWKKDAPFRNATQVYMNDGKPGGLKVGAPGPVKSSS